MKIVERKIADLIAAEYNPRKMSTEQNAKLTDSLKRFGMVDPVIVNRHPDRDSIVVGGHQRLRIWAELGNAKIPTVEVDPDRDHERELNVRLNRNTGDWDWASLADFNIDDLALWGFTEEELEKHIIALADVGGPVDLDSTDQGCGTLVKCPKCGFEHEVDA